MGKILGIDLGTTKSAIAYLEGSTPEIVLTPEGHRLLPSIVAFTSTGERLVGQPAKSQMITNPLNTISSVKTLMGKKYSEVEPYLNEFPFHIIRHGEDLLRIEVNNQVYSPEEISAMILLKLKDAADRYLSDPIDSVIITVPAYFNDSQRQATKDAGTIAGLNVKRIINEPTAASLAYSIDLKKKAKIIVYDFGGGTIDISVLDVQNGIIKVLATAGNTHLGGNNFDIALTQKLTKEFSDEHRIDLSRDKAALQRIREAAENAKIELSAVDECEINLPFIAESEDGPVHLIKYMRRSEFENLIKKDVESTLEICARALQNASLRKEDIDEFLLVGGSTRIPFVQQLVKEFFKRPPNRKVNPDEIVAMGAAMQGSIIKGDSKDILLLDVTPLSLGVKTFGGAFTRIINANTTIPTSRSLVFSTVEDNQTEVDIEIYQGEREIAEENKLLGKFTLLDIKRAPRGGPRIEVTFSININGIMNVSAMDLSSKNKKEVLISQSGLLSKEEVDRLREEAKKLSDVDLKKREAIHKKNKVINQIYSLNQLSHGSSLPAAMKAEIAALVREAEREVERENVPAMEALEKKMNELWQKASALDASMEPPLPRVEAPVPPAQADATPEKGKKEDTKPLKISF
ncbi:MAG TPA: molecular chaperone DnaK [Candidatus Aminicenantes bacterium]|nr:molecular chaperone DnaK [Candidatus Aminicenantes bacterium]